MQCVMQSYEIANHYTCLVIYFKFKIEIDFFFISSEKRNMRVLAQDLSPTTG